MSTGLFSAVVVGVGLVVAMISRAVVSDESEAMKSGSGKKCAPDASFFISEAKKNRLRFDRTYGGKTIEVAGYAGRIDRSRDGDILVDLHCGEKGRNPFECIQCRLSADREETVIGIDKGDGIVVRGVYREKEKFSTASLVLFDCRIDPNVRGEAARR